jgi:hypothetical protein
MPLLYPQRFMVILPDLSPAFHENVFASKYVRYFNLRIQFERTVFKAQHLAGKLLKYSSALLQST